MTGRCECEPCRAKGPLCASWVSQKRAPCSHASNLPPHATSFECHIRNKTYLFSKYSVTQLIACGGKFEACGRGARFCDTQDAHRGPSLPFTCRMCVCARARVCVSTSFAPFRPTQSTWPFPWRPSKHLRLERDNVHRVGVLGFDNVNPVDFVGQGVDALSVRVYVVAQ